MKHEKKISVKLKRSLEDSQKIGKLSFNGHQWAITIITKDDEINNFVFDSEEYREVIQIIKNHEFQRSKDE